MFTEHEYLDGTDLIHMNGRLYDPSIGRIISADTIIQQQKGQAKPTPICPP